MFKKTLVALLTFCLLGQNFAFAATQTPNEKASLKQLKEQVKADLNTFHQKYGNQTKNLLPAVLATAPLLVSEMSREELEAELIAARRMLAREKESMLLIKDISNDYLEALTNERAVSHALNYDEQLIKSLEERNVKLETQVSELTAEVERLTAKEAKQAKTIKSLGGKNAQWAAKYNELSQQLAAANKGAELSSRQFSTQERAALRKLFTDVSGYAFLFEDSERISVMIMEDELASLFKAIESGDKKYTERAFTSFVEECRNLGNESLVKYLENLVEEMRAAYAREGKYSARFIKDFIPKLYPLVRSPLGYTNARDISMAISIAKRVLSKSGLLMGAGLIVGLALLNTQEASAAEIAMANRIAENPELLANADDDALAGMESSELVTNTAREVAEILHAAAQLSAQDMETISQLYGQTDTQREKNLQQQEAKKAIKSSLQTVKAY